MTGAVKVLGNMAVVHNSVNADDGGKCANDTVDVVIADEDMSQIVLPSHDLGS